MKNLKTLLLVVGVVVLSSMKYTQIQSYSFKKAIEEKVITYHITGNPSSTHYNEPMIAKIYNKSANELHITIPAGSIFTAVFDEEQNLVTTREVELSINPKQEGTISISANCMESNDAAGNAQSKYIFSGMATGALMKLIQHLIKTKTDPLLGQRAVWNVIDEEPLENIYDIDTAAASTIREYISVLTGRTLPSRELMEDYRFNPHVEPKVAVQGSVEMSFSRPCNMSIAMFNTNGTVVRELLKNPNLQPGKHRLTYAFDSDIYKDDLYIIKAMKDGVVIYTREIDMT